MSEGDDRMYWRAIRERDAARERIQELKDRIQKLEEQSFESDMALRERIKVLEEGLYVAKHSRDMRIQVLEGVLRKVETRMRFDMPIGAVDELYDEVSDLLEKKA